MCKITKKTSSIAEILAKKCVNAKPLLKFTPENYDFNFTINKDFIRRFIYQFDQNKGHKFIGDYINGMFLKEDKSKQSMFLRMLLDLIILLKNILIKINLYGLLIKEQLKYQI